MPEAPRAAPFFVFLAIGSLPASLFPGAEYWLYAVKTGVAAVLLWLWRARILEMRWSFSPVAVAAGLAVAGLWRLADGRAPGLAEVTGLVRHWAAGGPMPTASQGTPWNPVAWYAGAPAVGWGLAIVRVLGRSLVVPPMEEVFYRSLVYRMAAGPDFQAVSLKSLHWRALALTSAIFGLAHPDQFLPAVVTGVVYQGLTVRRGRLGDAMLAHAVTNLALSLWAILSGRWEFT